jgi:type VI secretion system secreted protein VgrG
MADTNLDNTLLFETTASGVEAGDLFVREMHAVEALSAPYEVRITLETNVDGGIPPDAVDSLLDSSCAICFGPGGLHRISGVLRQLELVEMEMDGSRALYEATLVPRLWLSTLNRRSRCFNEEAVPDIIKKVLKELELTDGTDFELRLSESYTAREYVVQYEESDFAFLSRWMERLGMFYFFEQGDVEKLIIADSNSAMVPATEHSEVTYGTTAGQGILGAIQHMRRRDRRVPKSVHCRDYNWRTPGSLVKGDADIDADHGVGLQAFTGDHFKDDGEGATDARVRAEGFFATKHVYSAWTVNPDFSPGCRFTVAGAPVGELDGQYFITRAVHRASQNGEGAGVGDYRNEIEAIQYATPYRAPRVTPWPKIDGIIHAKIDAASVSSAAPVDEKGRYKVVFPYDLYGAFGGKASRWVRKSEPYSGPEYGMHFTLHVGAEVAVAHIHGDPDRPVILGSVPNATTISPLTSTNATRSAIRTRSGIMIDFQDDA